jgi:hypothetical protein
MLKRCFLLIAIALSLPVITPADQEACPWAFTMESADKKYIFVMLKSCYRGERAGRYDSDRYPQSGLYLNDGSTTPLWTVDWCGAVVLPSDGVHVVREGWEGTSESWTEEAITFFADGRRLKSYRVCDLVTIPWLLPHSYWGYQWRGLISPGKEADLTIVMLGVGARPYRAGVVFDESAHTMEIETRQGDTYLFDLSTGETLSARRPFRTIAIFLLAVVVLFYGCYLFRATARPRLPLWKDYTRVSFRALEMAWVFTVLGVALYAADINAAAGSESGVMSGIAWRVFVDLPIDLAQRNGCEWANPYGFNRLYYRAQGALYIIGFWCSILAIAGMANNSVVRCLRWARQRWTGRALTGAPVTGLSADEMSYAAPGSTKVRTFREVQHLSRFWLGLLAVFLSVWAAFDLSDALERSEIIANPTTIPVFLLLGVLLPVFLLNVKMVTAVRRDHLVIGLRLLWFQNRKIAFAEIRQCSIQPRISHEYAELMVKKYAVWAKLGVLIEMAEGDWVLVGSQRPQELLDAIRAGRSNPT